MLHCNVLWENECKCGTSCSVLQVTSSKMVSSFSWVLAWVLDLTTRGIVHAVYDSHCILHCCGAKLSELSCIDMDLKHWLQYSSPPSKAKSGWLSPCTPRGIVHAVYDSHCILSNPYSWAETSQHSKTSHKVHQNQLISHSRAQPHAERLSP